MAALLLGSIVTTHSAPLNTDKDERNFTGNIMLNLGSKILKKSDWDILNKHIETGILFDISAREWPVYVEVGYAGSEDTALSLFGPENRATTKEFIVGAKKIWNPANRFNVFLGGGLASISASIDVVTRDGVTGWPAVTTRVVTDKDRSTGIYMTTGFYWTFFGWMNMGYRLSYSKADVTLFGEKRDAGGIHHGLLAGVSW